MMKLLNELKKPTCDGLSLSGGDPLFPGNCSTVKEICRRAKEVCPEKEIALWTGYCIEDLSREQREVLQYVDWVIDGQFIEELKDISLKWRGSSNQRILKHINGIFIDVTEQFDNDARR